MTTHELKTHPVPFQRVDEGLKTYEVRKADRDFQVGDILHLREWDPDRMVRHRSCYTGNGLYVRVVYITMPGQWGLPADLCVMGIVIAPEEPHAD